MTENLTLGTSVQVRFGRAFANGVVLETGRLGGFDVARVRLDAAGAVIDVDRTAIARMAQIEKIEPLGGLFGGAE